MSPRITVHAAGALDAAAGHTEVERKLSIAERLWASATLRKLVLILGIALVWELYARHLDNPLLFPTLTDTVTSLVDHTLDGTLPLRVWSSLKILADGL